MLAHLKRNDPNKDIGKPIKPMINFVVNLIRDGNTIKIFTARAHDPKQKSMIQKWLEQQGLFNLEITNVKDSGMMLLFDDRAMRVERNKGNLCPNCSINSDYTIEGNFR